MRLRYLAKEGRRWYLPTISPVVFRRRRYLYVVTRMASGLAAAPRDSPYFPANLFPSRSVGAFSVAGPRQGVGDLMQNRVTDFMWGLQVGADEVNGNRNAFFQQAAHSQPSFGPIPAELPVCQTKFIHFQASVSFNIPEAVAFAGLVVPHGHVAGAA